VHRTDKLIKLTPSLYGNVIVLHCEQLSIANISPAHASQSSALCAPLTEQRGRSCYTVQPWRPWYSRLLAARFNHL